MKFFLFILTFGLGLFCQSQPTLLVTLNADTENRIMKIAMSNMLSTLTPRPFEVQKPHEQEKFNIILAGLNATSGKAELDFTNCLEIRESFIQVTKLKMRSEALTRKMIQINENIEKSMDADESITHKMYQKIFQWAVCVADETRITTESSLRLEQQRIDRELQQILSELARIRD